ncbi:hypothetical protein CDO44_24480 [Pigmentiphaga sp. NML080357]|uniref:Crp/Fnr family transcriptional regulator n=1 Tax=Pigmentiphaga sp. NML080357 TaxID=2008675 RepID=UPI000B413BAB|nr:Crp/Fnr family transcriptional regulator [Pigmentiphaga sp. NML080357]OVZ55372.1 hypothetical protein CDO44_24480 [Pigmentiphaga sp. NML080357]
MATRETAFALLLDGLPDAQADAVHRCLAHRRLSPGQTLFRQAEPSPRFWVIRSGRMRTYHLSPGGEEFTTAVWSTGHTLGLLSALLDQPRAISCEALETVSLLSMERADLLALMETMPRFAINVAKVAASLAANSIARSGPRVLDSATAKLARILHDLALAVPGYDGGSVEIVGVTQTDLAKMAGISRTWVSLRLAEFERAGLVRRARGRLLIPEAARLVGLYTGAC